MYNHPNIRENQLFFADNYYLSARFLILNGFSIIGGVVAAQAVERYLKLKIYELFSDNIIKKEKVMNNHKTAELFRLVKHAMDLNDLHLRSFSYYKKLLLGLDELYKFRYFDDKGLLGEMDKSVNTRKRISFGVGVSKEILNVFDEICCELRNSVFLSAKHFFQTDETEKKAFYKENKWAEKFLLE